MFYYNFNIGDYLKHTAHLTSEEDLAYRRLLDVYYDTETPIPNDIPRVSRRLRVASETVKLVLEEFFHATEEGYRNKRADREIAAYHAFLQKQKSNGIKGGRPKTKPTDNPRVSQPEPKITLNENRETRTEKQIKESTSDASRPNPARKKVPLPSDFAVSPRVSAWATEKGFDRLPDHLDAFRRKAEMNAYRYADWDLAFMEAVREDWAKLRGNGRVGPAPVAVPDGTIKCETCGTRTRQFTGRQCDPCWRGVVNPRVAA